MADLSQDTLRVATHNVQGLNSPVKRRTFFNFYKSSKLDIVLIQDTNFPAKYCPKFLHSHYSNFYLASAENKSKGVAIAFAKTCNFSWIADIKEPNSRFLLVKGEIDGQIYSLVSYYTPNKGQAHFFQNLLSVLSPALEGTVIFGGDSNTAFDQGLDKSKPPAESLTCPSKQSQNS